MGLIFQNLVKLQELDFIYEYIIVLILNAVMMD